MTSLIRQRFLASSDYDNLDDVDQTEVSKFLIIILTLALILLIEGLRRKIDALAHGHQFFQAVLELIYREVTTLGIVEFFLYLVHKYSDAYGSQTEETFVDVHFLLFYTALFNALQGCLLRILAGLRTDRSWVYTESIDVGHYVAIRKEFDRLETILPRLHTKQGISSSIQSSSYWNSCQRILHDLTLGLRQPQLYRRRNTLLRIIRFHELRAHLIDSNDLPPRFRVSHYLKRSLTSVMLDFVHISPVTWIMLMATTNLMYFTMEMIMHLSLDSLQVERFIAYIPISMMSFFAVFALVLYFKLHLIFDKILHMKLTVIEDNIRKSWTGFSALSSFYTKTVVDQRDLFWGSNPRIVIVIIQYMQFGFAFAFSVVFTFHQEIQANKSLSNVFFPYPFLGFALTYVIFLMIMTDVLPWYTLCTSMGQLVNQERLHESLAEMKLEEEMRKIDSIKEEKKIEEEIKRRRRSLEITNAKSIAKAADVSKIGPSNQRRRLMKTQSDGISSMRSVLPKTPECQVNMDIPEIPISTHKHWSSRHQRKKSLSDGVTMMTVANDSVASEGVLLSKTCSFDYDREPKRLITLSELTQVSVNDLPEIPKFKHSIKSNRQRRKTVSDGVAQMNRQRRKTVSDGVAQMRADEASTFDVALRNVEPNKAGQEGDGSFVSKSTKGAVSFAAEPRIIAEVSRQVSINGDSSEVTDIADFPEATTTTRQDRMHARMHSINVTKFFQSSLYRTLSALFGPMACFSVVSAHTYAFNPVGLIIRRVEVFNNYITGVSNNYIMPFLFWLEISLYCIMMVEMSLIIVIFLRNIGSRGPFIACFAATIGLSINLMCLVLLVVAETKRCCSETGVAENYFFSEYAAIEECCPKFGRRLFNGLGIIEPFTALIALSPLRFLVASKIAGLFRSSADCLDEMFEHDDKHELNDHGPDPTVKMRSLWLTAIGAHSKIADSYGLFSSELLLCMLGIYSYSSTFDEKESMTSSGDCQSPDGMNEVSDTVLQHKDGIGQVALDGSFSKPADFRTSFDQFFYPKSRLICRMRRCERRLLPLMDEWMVVDVVITKHEIVLFDVVNEIDDRWDATLDSLDSSEGFRGLCLCDVAAHMRANGRKIVSQFNLSEIDFIELEHRYPITHEGIEAYDVELNRVSLHEYWDLGDNGLVEDNAVENMNKQWRHVDEDRLKISFTASSIWSGLHSTLFLRFMVDLKVLESKRKIDELKENVDDVGSEARLWCRTIARLRGQSNLKLQHLPHFGDDSRDEIEDFVKHYDREHDDIQNSVKSHRSLHRRRISGALDLQNLMAAYNST